MLTENQKWKLTSDPGPDPLTYKALLSEYRSGSKQAAEEVENTQVSPESAAMNLEVGDVKLGAEEVIDLMKRLIVAGQRGSVRVNPERLFAKLSAGLSRVAYNLGKIEGYREAGRLR